MPVTWLHISDLHLRNDDSYDRVVVLRSLVKSVKHFRQRDGRAPDFIFVTGDVAYSGKPDEYVVVGDFLDELLDAAALTRRRLYVLPGNHDVDRTVGRQLLRQLSTRDEADEYFHPGAPWLHLRHKMGPFSEWYNAYFNGIRSMPTNTTCGPVELITQGGVKLGLLPINTALFCQDDYDHERLCVGRRCIDTAITELNSLEADLKIALMHHPIQYLSIIDRQHVRAALVDHVDVILTGHLHEEAFFSVDMWSSRNLSCAAGATYQTRNYPNKAYYATFDKDHVAIFPIRYEDQPRETWTVDPSVFPDCPETGYEESFPVPRGPDFRSFRLPLGRQLGPNLSPTAVATVAIAGTPEPRLEIAAAADEQAEREQKRARKQRATKSKTKSKKTRGPKGPKK